MSELVVLDASAALALLHREHGHEIVARRMSVQATYMSAVNVFEVISKQGEAGIPESEAMKYLRLVGIDMIPFGEADALEAGRLRRSTRSLGLSLGDRACLALGRRLNALVLTADRAWLDADVGIDIEWIRDS